MQKKRKKKKYVKKGLNSKQSVTAVFIKVKDVYFVVFSESSDSVILVDEYLPLGLLCNHYIFDA